MRFHVVFECVRKLLLCTACKVLDPEHILKICAVPSVQCMPHSSSERLQRVFVLLLLLRLVDADCFSGGNLAFELVHAAQHISC